MFSLMLTSAIMSGLIYEVNFKLHETSDQITLTSQKPNQSVNWHQVRQWVMQTPEVVSVTPYYETYALLAMGERMLPVLVKGIDPKLEQASNPLLTSIKLQTFLPKSHYHFLAMRQPLGIASPNRTPIELIVPKFKAGFLHQKPISKRVVPAGDLIKQYGLSSQIIYMHLNDIMSLMGVKEPSGLKIKTTFDADVSMVAFDIIDKYPSLNVHDWSQSHRLWLENLAMQKRVFSIFLSLLVMVAMFSLVANLTMLVTEKKAEIAMMKTMGSSNGLIIRIFMWMALILTTLGIMIGVGSGYWVIKHMAVISSTIEQALGIKFFAPTLWPIDFVPTRLSWPEVKFMVYATLSLSLLVAYIPARRAIKIPPAQALSYEA